VFDVRNVHWIANLARDGKGDGVVKKVDIGRFENIVDFVRIWVLSCLHDSLLLLYRLTICMMGGRRDDLDFFICWAVQMAILYSISHEGGFSAGKRWSGKGMKV
jgi:hypothetical protein